MNFYIFQAHYEKYCHTRPQPIQLSSASAGQLEACRGIDITYPSTPTHQTTRPEAKLYNLIYDHILQPLTYEHLT